jgi:hypothetical protein
VAVNGKLVAGNKFHEGEGKKEEGKRFIISI